MHGITDDTRILILCTGNSCRSQMAEGFMRHHLRKLGLNKAATSVRSAGIEVHGLNPRAVTVMAEEGIDISRHTSNKLSEYGSETFDYVITVCDNAAAHCPVYPAKTMRVHWPFDDPARAEGTEQEIMNRFRRVRDEISEKISHWLKKTAKPEQGQSPP